jgi:hypothetical protein
MRIGNIAKSLNIRKDGGGTDSVPWLREKAERLAGVPGLILQREAESFADRRMAVDSGYVQWVRVGIVE